MWWPFNLFQKKENNTPNVRAAAQPIVVNPSLAEREKRAAARLVIVQEQVARWTDMPKTHPKYSFRDKKLKEFTDELSALKVKLGVS